ncbi:RNA polymerase subunit sigma [Streptomyces sp. Act143]|uniref:RNA polymerase subunit sigma n=1 Tax=Streptomyces sp. Act143 TaxID=2200760 RepID=UPI000D67D009|nr:RNA polymerase subunit sigma [Streptomyces sp. Act143]PWI14790.1 RNA polymerase subunit sigma [Streptomyces sp. Act143]
MEDVEAVPIAELVEERRYLLDVALSVLGDAGGPGEAERVVDEVYRHWYGLRDTARREITRPRSWLARCAGRCSLRRLAASGRGTDGTRIGTAGVTTADVGAGPQEGWGEQAEAWGEAAEAREGAAPTWEGSAEAWEGPAEACEGPAEAWERLAPAWEGPASPERAAIVRGAVFATASDADAEGSGRNEPECVDPADSARHGLRARQSRPVPAREQDALTRAVARACLRSDEEALTALLCADATAYFDGGGKVRAPDRPVHGGRAVARTLLTSVAGRPGTGVAAQSVNGRTGLVVRYGHQVAAVIGLDVADHRVALVWVTVNPDKLRSWNRC